MALFELMNTHAYGEVHVVTDPKVGLEAIIAVHDDRLGPALGGCRFIEYAKEEDAFFDAIRLARGMTQKAAITGLGHGGGKSVIRKPQGPFDRKALFTSFGRAIERLGGRYITAEDSGTSVEDMNVIRDQTKHVTGVSVDRGGSGDPSPWTALGVRRGIEASVKVAYGASDLKGLHVAVQGVGHVGYHVCKEVHALGAQLTVADADASRLERVQKEFGAKVVGKDEILAVACDVLAPCALGAIINDTTIPHLKTKVIAGASNNQLLNASHGKALFDKGIVYAPDYAINAGGLVNVAQEVLGYDEPQVREKVMKIYDTIFMVLNRSKESGIPADQVADQIVQEKLKLVH